MELTIQIIGWVGMVLIVGAYFLVSQKKIDSQSIVYQLMNLSGSIAMGINVFHQRAWPAVVLQIVWSLIAISVLFRILK